MGQASDRPGDYITRGAAPSSSVGLGRRDEGESTVLVGVEGPRLYWRITLWLPLGRRGRYASYAVSTRLLPSGRIEVVGPSGRARRLAPGAEQCGCGRPECIHLRGMRAHLAEVVQHHEVL